MSQMAKIERIPAYRILADAVMGDILARRFAPGEQLPTEAKLCEIFGVNRSTVREGMRLLEENGVLRRIGAKRLVVGRPSNGEVGDQLERAFVLHEITLKEIWEAMTAIEPTMARFAAQNSDRKGIAVRFHANLAATKEALEKGESLTELDVEFHSIVATSSNSRALILAHEPLRRFFFPAFEIVLSTVPPAGARLLKAHQEIAAAIIAGDQHLASLWMERHIRDFKRGFDVGMLDIFQPVGRAASPKISPIEDSSTP
jgi:GntR family transcriptional repressor for pyruvate dehydrogenase complex